MSLATIVALTREPYNPVKPLEKTNNTEPRTALTIWSAWFPVSYYLETTQKDWQVGQWKHDYSTMASEMTHPYYRFLDAGMQVDLASVKGGKIPVDPQTLNRILKTPEDDRFLADPAFLAKVENSMRIDDVDFTQYDIIFMSGGWGAAYDLGYSPVLAEKVSEAYYASNEPVIGGVCHGVLGLINAKDRDGKPLIAGRRMTGVTDKQIKELGIEITPQHPETELRKAGVVFESNTRFIDFLATLVVVDDEERFVTGQNQNSGRETAHKMLVLIAEKS
jgi:putative intracellular protease/amidase